MAKILFLVTQSEQGGAGKYVLSLAKSLKTKNLILVASNGGPESWLAKELTKNNIPFYPLKYLQRSLSPEYDFLALKEIKKLYQFFQPQIVHLNSSKAGVLGALAAGKKHSFLVVYTAHGFVFHEPTLSWLRRKFYFWAENFSASYKDKIITLTKEDYALAQKMVGPEKAALIPNGLDLNECSFLERAEARQALGLEEKGIVVGDIANYYPTKGLSRFVNAAKIITQKFAKAKFVLIGQGQQEKELTEQIKKLELTNNFLLGPLEQAHRYLKAFDVFLFPSLKEGFPFAILEAMAAETPIVATAVGGLKDMIIDGKDGFLVPSWQGKKEQETEQQLAKKVIYLLEHPEIKKIFTANARQKLEKEFTLEKMVAKTKQVYGLA